MCVNFFMITFNDACFYLHKSNFYPGMKEGSEKLRLDKYLWSIRIFKTRAKASEACDKGRVRFSDAATKASKNVQIGDEYEIRGGERKWIIKVTALLDHRVQYSEATKYYVDLTPVQETEQMQASSFHTGKRLSKIGRPTKKQRRNLSDFTE
jgi:ribosome-associated heat shock protein Hsp15